MEGGGLNIFTLMLTLTTMLLGDGANKAKKMKGLKADDSSEESQIEAYF